MDTGIPLFLSEIEYLLLETIPLYTIMRVLEQNGFSTFLMHVLSHCVGLYTTALQILVFTLATFWP